MASVDVGEVNYLHELASTSPLPPKTSSHSPYNVHPIFSAHSLPTLYLAIHPTEVPSDRTSPSCLPLLEQPGWGVDFESCITGATGIVEDVGEVNYLHELASTSPLPPKTSSHSPYNVHPIFSAHSLPTLYLAIHPTEVPSDRTSPSCLPLLEQPGWGVDFESCITGATGIVEGNEWYQCIPLDPFHDAMHRNVLYVSACV
ncbi:hypothetical protein GQ42DRAFT_171645 [Ramicandelaber brevisporus]|nr:hypothetical protein GQ42DRAFT_171645 [Ramicandelaber brevisporus]